MLQHFSKAYVRVLETACCHLNLYREAKLMADIKDLAARAAALGPRVQAALAAAADAAHAAGAAVASASLNDSLDAIDAGLAAVESLAPALAPVEQPAPDPAVTE